MSNNRRVFLINKNFQLSLVKLALLGSAVLMGIFYFSNLYFLKKLEQYGLEAALPKDHIYFQFIAEQAALMNMIFLLTAALATLFIIIGVIWISHRIAGPIYRICKELEQNSDSNQQKIITLRTGDYFPELAETINNFLSKKG